VSLTQQREEKERLRKILLLRKGEKEIFRSLPTPKCQPRKKSTLNRGCEDGGKRKKKRAGMRLLIMGPAKMEGEREFSSPHCTRGRGKEGYGQGGVCKIASLSRNGWGTRQGVGCLCV